jgi:hypothetical protein
MRYRGQPVADTPAPLPPLDAAPFAAPYGMPFDVPRDDAAWNMPRDDVAWNMPLDDAAWNMPRDDVAWNMPLDDAPWNVPRELHDGGQNVPPSPARVVEGTRKRRAPAEGPRSGPIEAVGRDGRVAYRFADVNDVGQERFNPTFVRKALTGSSKTSGGFAWRAARD